jgi:hypothetical protein
MTDGAFIIEDITFFFNSFIFIKFMPGTILNK